MPRLHGIQRRPAQRLLAVLGSQIVVTVLALLPAAGLAVPYLVAVHASLTAVDFGIHLAAGREPRRHGTQRHQAQTPLAVLGSQTVVLSAAGLGTRSHHAQVPLAVLGTQTATRPVAALETQFAVAVLETQLAGIAGIALAHGLDRVLSRRSSG